MKNLPLNEIENRIGMVLRRAHAGVFVWDLANNTVVWSPELYELLGIDPSTPSQTETFVGMIHPEDRPKAWSDTQAAISRGGTFYHEFRVTRPDGEMIWLSSIGFVEHDPEGRPLTLTGINQDITERKKAEQALENAHAEVMNERNRLMAVMEALPIGVAIYDINGGVIQANRGFDDIWGSPRPEANTVADYEAYKAWWVESGQPVKPEEWAAAQAVQEGKTVINQYFEIERFDGSHHFVLNSGAPVFNVEGQVIGCAVAISDITERVQAERALLESQRSLREIEERFRVVLSSLPMTVYMLDRDLRYTWVYNPQFGMTAEQMLGKRDEDIYPQVPTEFINQLKSVIETGQGIQREMKTDVFGDAKVILLSVEPFRDVDGTVTGLIGIGLDVTERRRLEMERLEAIRQVEIQRQIVENREKERQEIAREIHDGPIQTLVGMMFSMHMTKEAVSNGAVDHATVGDALDQLSASLKSAVSELRDAVNNLRPPALLRFGLGKALQAYAEDFQSKHPELELEVLFDLPDDGDGLYLSEETRLSLYRLCQEGLNNIIRHAQATRARIRVAQARQRIILEIHDNGNGFTVPKDLSRKTEEGHFGLAGMKERVQAMGGEFHINSMPGVGTVIEVMIPQEEANI